MSSRGPVAVILCLVVGVFALVTFLARTAEHAYRSEEVACRERGGEPHRMVRGDVLCFAQGVLK